MTKKPYPAWICTSCAEEAGGKIPANHLACWHVDKCGVCGGTTAVTQPRDWGYPKGSKISRLILTRRAVNEKTKKA